MVLSIHTIHLLEDLEPINNTYTYDRTPQTARLKYHTRNQLGRLRLCQLWGKRESSRGAHQPAAVRAFGLLLFCLGNVCPCLTAWLLRPVGTRSFGSIQIRCL
jgi:hypothetical protein